MSTPNRYRHTLEKLTAEPPATKTALISILLLEIESALASGKTRRQIWQRLVEDGFDLSYDTFHSTLWRVQGKPRITAATRRKLPKPQRGRPRSHPRRRGTIHSLICENWNSPGQVFIIEARKT
jgi:hypothetical protein